MKNRGIGLLLLLIFYFGDGAGQSYPRWFLSQGALKCSNTFVGFAKVSYFPDSSVAHAITNGLERFARQRSSEIRGGQAFWSTDVGTFWMGSNFEDIFDSSATGLIEDQISVLDTFFTDNYTAVLLKLSDCQLEARDKQIISIAGLKAPNWIETPPKDDRFHYGVGMAPEYYYEQSSWELAEQLARRNLARSIYIELKAMQKMAVSNQEIRNEELVVPLSNVQTVARWRDLDKKIFYVLVRMSKGAR